MYFGHVIESVTLGVMIISAIFGNSCVCWVTYDTRNSEPITAMFMMNLAATDLLKGLIEMPFAFITLVSGDPYSWLLGDIFCQITAFVGQTLRLASTLSVACISLDRYYVIMYALDYQSVMTQFKAKLMVITTWVIAAIISLLPILDVGLYRFLPATHHCTADWIYSPIYSSVVLSVGFLLPLTVTSICNFQIFRAARSQSRRVDVFSSSRDTRAIPVRGDRRRRPSQRQMWRPPRHRARAAKIILVVFGTFFCCWTAYVTVHIWNYTRFDPESKSAWYEMLSWAGSISTDDPYALHRWPITVVTFIAFSSAAINPYVYTLLHRRMRKTLRKLVIRLFCRGRVDYRRSTIAFAANFNGRGRSARQRMLNMKIFSTQNPESDLLSSDIAQGSSSNREGQTSLDAPLDSTTPGEYPSSFVSINSPQYENRNQLMCHHSSGFNGRNPNNSSVPPGEYDVESDEESDVGSSKAYPLLRRLVRYPSAFEPETEKDNTTVDSLPAWNVQGGSRWVGNELSGRSRRAAASPVTWEKKRSSGIP